MAYNTLLVETDGPLAIVTVNRPKAMNALNDEFFTELNQLLDELEGNGQTRVMIVTGAEKAFVAGADIVELMKADSEGGRRISDKGTVIFRRMEKSNIVSIAAVNGFALGGGWEFAMACDIRIASEKAKMGQPEVSLGVIPGYGGTQRLARLVGPGKAKELILTGDMVGADEGLKIGLVEKVVAPDELMDEAKKMASKILSKGPVAVRIAKECINYGMETDLDDGLEYETRKFGEIFGTEDKNEGTKAFLDKRKPEFKNK